MVSITFCAYSSGDSEFLLNISSNSSKSAGRYGDLNLHMNTMATRKDLSRSQDPVFSMVALGIIQKVLSEDLARLFTDRKFGDSLLARSKSSFSFEVLDRFFDCPVFLQGRTAYREPDKDYTYKNKPLRHPSDRPAYG